MDHQTNRHILRWEKKLYDPDDYECCWFILKIEEKVYSTWQMGGRSLMVCLAVGYGGKTSSVFLNGKQKRIDNILVTESELLPYGSDLGGEELIFKQERTSIHFDCRVKNWFFANNAWINRPVLNFVKNI
ncbi:hypothetical protein AVEN_182640-1 [Araneus ventricosus]|uniref:Uncharacterized protein n=1 Tax=Araneus ventricosus TaxID=182803 RepID=A0A4Y2M3P4_ARAVE|nr:hypothetical protein AVEN_182640-1 [Araneus ventricosus]